MREGRRLESVDLEVACDVSNPLLGPAGAAATYGPQKGARPDDVAFLDRRNADWADELEAREGRRERDTPGAARRAVSALPCSRSRIASGPSRCAPGSSWSSRRPTSRPSSIAPSSC